MPKIRFVVEVEVTEAEAAQMVADFEAAAIQRGYWNPNIEPVADQLGDDLESMVRCSSYTWSVTEYGEYHAN